MNRNGTGQEEDIKLYNLSKSKNHFQEERSPTDQSQHIYFSNDCSLLNDNDYDYDCDKCNIGYDCNYDYNNDNYYDDVKKCNKHKKCTQIV